MTSACGIDFGTSNSAVAFSRKGRTVLVRHAGGVVSIPTAIFFSFEEDATVFGRDAVARYLDREEGRLLRALKSLLGSALFDETTQIKARSYTFSEIIAAFLAHLRAAAAQEAGGAPAEVVLGRPAFFVDDDTKADAQAQHQLEGAALAAGFTSVEFQFEPIAAALAYEQSVSAEEIALVADIGGGTSDFSVVRVSPERAGKPDRRGDILAYNGVHIGGTDFDRLLSLSTLMPFLGLRSKLKMKGMDAPSWYFADLSTWHRINYLYEPRVLTDVRSVRRDSAEPDKIERLVRVIERRKGHDLLGRIEQSKIGLSDTHRVQIALGDVVDGLALGVTRAEFEGAIAAELARIEERVRAAIRLAGLAPADVATIFLTGGTSGVPAVRAAIARVVPAARMVAGDAFASVATGLAIDAARRFGPG
jgi:hypothetical chaperone protein